MHMSTTRKGTTSAKMPSQETKLSLLAVRRSRRPHSMPWMQVAMRIITVRMMWRYRFRFSLPPKKSSLQFRPFTLPVTPI